MAVLLTPPYLQFLDNNGYPLSGGKVYTYASGTTTPKATYTDNSEATEQANPVELDAAGRAVIWVSGAYRFSIKDVDDNLIRTVDGVTSFNTLADSVTPYFESFSGDGVQTAFTLSQNVGTESKNLMIFVDSGLQECALNGDFATDSVWTKGAGWSIDSGEATASSASSSLEQDSDVTLMEGQSYNVTYTVTRSAGNVKPVLGGTEGTSRSSAGTYTETIIAGNTQKITFTGSSFSGTIDDVSVTQAVSSGVQYVDPTAYTVDGTALSFSTAPALGTGNIKVLAPSLLLGAASYAASQAQASEAAALTAKEGAEGAQTAAEIAQAAAESALDNFTDLYLGAKASPPSVDNDGDPLQAGMLYQDTIVNAMRFYDGSAWNSIMSFSGNASEISYDNSTSGLPAGNVQAAIDEAIDRTQIATQAEAEAGTGNGLMTAELTKQAIDALASTRQTDNFFLIQDQQADGAGRAGSAGVNIRVLNTIVINNIPGASLSSNRVTLPAGTYYVEADPYAQYCDTHQAALWNYTDNEVVIAGVTAYSTNGNNNVNSTNSDVVGVFTISSEKQFEIRHDISRSYGSAFGIGGPQFAINKVNMNLKIWKVA